MPERTFVCSACGYLNAETVRGICIRCQNACREESSSELAARQRNYYTYLARLATAPGGYPDPFPLRVLEHTAQISTEDAAKRERYFQGNYSGSRAGIGG